jgi:membrane fusion protein, multidrug efflux system
MAEADPSSIERARMGAPSPAALPAAPGAWRSRILFFALPVAIILAGAAYWLLSDNAINTDNAYVKQDMTSVGPDVSGRIVRVFVSENQQIKAGAPLFEIDPEPYRVALAQADAQIAKAQVNVQELQAEFSSTGVDIEKASTNIEFARSEYERQRQLSNQGFTTKVRLEAAQHALNVAQAEFAAARAGAAEARSKLATGTQVPGVNPELAVARAQRAKALMDLSRTLVRAPISGRVSQTERLQIGQMLAPGFPALSIIGNERSWIEANFKETELDKIRPGQSTTIRFDAYPSVKLKGHVASIGGGTGSEFSVLPAQNANGNWVKVTQRIPVRIAIDNRPDRDLIAGLSARVSVHIDD